jgi:hypothetical protein
MRSSPLEENNSDYGEKEDRNSPPDKAVSSIPLGSLSNTGDNRDSRRTPHADADMEHKQVRSKGNPGSVEAVAKGGDFYPHDSSVDDDDPAAENTSVDEIQMSPIPFDREDPTSLMELPENIMILPISPCGPYDG